MTMSATFTPSRVPGLTTVQMIEVDRAMIEDFRIELIQMMEKATRGRSASSRSLAVAGTAAAPWLQPVGCTTGALRSPWGSLSRPPP